MRNWLRDLRWWIDSELRSWVVVCRIDEELDFHLEQTRQELRRQGFPPKLARRLAEERFGDRRRYRDSCLKERRINDRKRKRGDRMGTLWQDLRFGVRVLLKNPGFTIIALLTLGLAIGANSAIFSIVNGVLWSPLPYADPDRLVIVWETDRHNGTTREGASVPDFFDFRERNRVFEQLIAFGSGSVTLTGLELPEQVLVSAVSWEMLSLLGRRPIAGRDFVEAEGQVGGDRVALVGESFSRQHFGEPEAAPGVRIVLDGVSTLVIGVMPSDFNFPTTTQVWRPLQITPTSSPRGNHGILVAGRLKPGVTLEKAQEEMSAIASQLEQEYPDDNQARGVNLVPLMDQVVGNVRPALRVLMAAVGIVLLIACANVASLMLARATVRAREVGIRGALGASRTRLVQQFLAESLILSLAAGALGLGLAFVGLRVLVYLAPSNLPRLDQIGIDPWAALFTACAALGTGLLFGLGPAWSACRKSLSSGLNDGGRTASTGLSGGRFRRVLVVAEVSLSLVLVVSAGLLIRSLLSLQRIDPGFQPAGLVKISLNLPASRYPQARRDFPNFPEVRNFQNRLLERVRAIPGVESAALGMNHPLLGGWTTRFQIDGRPDPTGIGRDEANIRPVSPGYFQTAGMRIRQGRPFNEQDRADSPPMIILNETMAKRYFPDQSAVGQRVSFWGTSREIVGVVNDVKFDGLASSTPIAMYPLLSQLPMTNFNLLVRSSLPIESLGATLRNEITQLDPDLATFGFSSMNEMLSGSMAQERFNALVLGVFAVVALILATVGIFGVVSQAVEQRLHEIGIRLAMGASPGSVLQMVLKSGMLLTGIGLGIGLAGAFFATRALSGMLFGVNHVDPVTYSIVPLVLALTAAAACIRPARRAASLDPLQTLRSE